jgi:hypothetical protein
VPAASIARIVLPSREGADALSAAVGGFKEAYSPHRVGGDVAFANFKLVASNDR